MSAHDPISTELSSKARAFLQQGRTEDAGRILGELNKRSVQSIMLDGLQAWHLVQTAENHTRRALTQPHESSHWTDAFKSQWVLKREREAVEVLKQGLKHHPDCIGLHLRLSSQYATTGAYELALQHCEDAVQIDPTHPEALNRRAEVSVITLAPNAADAIKQLYAAAPERWLDVHNHYLALGQASEAAAVFRTTAKNNPNDISPQVGVAKMALWRGEVDEATSFAHTCIDNETHIAEAHALLGMVLSMRKDPDAVGHLLKAHTLGLPPDSPIGESELSCWVAIDYLRHKHWENARSWCDKAKASSRSGHLTAYLLRVIAEDGYNGHHSSRVNPRWHQHIERFGPIAGDLPEGWRENYTTFYAVVIEILRNLKGNLSPTPTWIENGTLMGLLPQGLQHHHLRFNQQRIRVQPTDEIWSQFQRFMAKNPENPQVYTYSGEVLLWTGRYAEAEALFRQALDRSFLTIWTWIGLGASLGYQGDTDGALAAFADGIKQANFEGPTVFVYRGEFHRKAGRLDLAARDLDVAIRSKPQRLSAWINRVLVDHAMGNPSPAKRLCRTLLRVTPGLWWDASKTAGTDPVSLDNCHEVLEAMLDLMLGNRSSTIITYRMPGKPLRGVKWRRNDVPAELAEQYGVTR